MALNFSSKHGIIIGVVTILGSLFLSLSELPRVASIFDPDDYSSSIPLRYKVQRIATLVLVMLAGLASVVLILGIVKKRHLLVAPWLVVGFLLSAFLSFTLIHETVIRTYFHLENYIPIVLVIGLEIIVLYPIWHLFKEIRSGNATGGNPQVSKSNYAHNLQQYSVAEVSQKSII